MKQRNPLPKLFIQIIYMFIFFGLCFLILIAISFLFTLIVHKSPGNKKLYSIFYMCRGFLGFIIFIYSFWVSKESAIAVTENNCFFFEAIIVSIKKTGTYLQFLPIIGSLFDNSTPENLDDQENDNP